MNRTLVIAEPGGTHEGRWDLMERLIVTAHQCGADAFKNQWTSDPARMCARRNAGEYAESYQKLAFPIDWHARCRKLCHELKMQYGCSTYLPDDAERVAPYVEFHKIASFENHHIPHLTAPVIVSSGMMDHEALTTLRADHPRLIILHCVSSYPAPIEQMNLAVLSAYGLDGLSDHSQSLMMGYAAVCAGARFIEAHYRLDDCDPENKDYAVAFDPFYFQEYIKLIREAERIMGDPRKRLQPCESQMLGYKVRHEPWGV